MDTKRPILDKLSPSMGEWRLIELLGAGTGAGTARLSSAGYPPLEEGVERAAVHLYKALRFAPDANRLGVMVSLAGGRSITVQLAFDDLILATTCKVPADAVEIDAGDLSRILALHKELCKVPEAVK